MSRERHGGTRDRRKKLKKYNNGHGGHIKQESRERPATGDRRLATTGVPNGLYPQHLRRIRDISEDADADGDDDDDDGHHDDTDAAAAAAGDEFLCLLRFLRFLGDKFRASFLRSLSCWPPVTEKERESPIPHSLLFYSPQTLTLDYSSAASDSRNFFESKKATEKVESTPSSGATAEQVRFSI